MDTEFRRMLLFIFGCIGLRSLMAYMSYTRGNTKTPLLNLTTNQILAIFTLIAGIGFMIIYYGGYRKTAYEAGGKVWWNKIRHIHGLLYLLFTISVFTNYGLKQPWKLLLTDVIIGTLFYVFHKIKPNL